MPTTIWVLLLAGLAFYLVRTLSREPSSGGFDPASFSYRPSEEVAALLEAGDPIETIRAIRAETGLGLRDGRDLFE